MTEAEIRADERARCYADLKALACEFVEKWGPIYGEDRAKAEAWNILVAAERIRRAPTVSGEPK